MYSLEKMLGSISPRTVKVKGSTATLSKTVKKLASGERSAR